MAADVSYQFKDYSDEVIAAINEKVNLALNLMGEVVEGYAKEDCPVDTGLLRNSITHTLGGQSMSFSYHASYGTNRNKAGKRYTARAKNAGSVGFGTVSGSVGGESDNSCYVGTNVEYGPAVEFGEYAHKSGKAHFLRDGATNHIAELRDVAQNTLSTINGMGNHKS